MSALYNRGMGELRKPNVQEAQAAFQEALTFTPAGSEVMRYLPQAGLAMAQARLNAPEAQEALEAARLSAEAVGDEFMAAALETDLGRTLLRQGNFALAEGHLGRAIAYYRRTDMIPYLVSVLPVLAELQDRQGQNATSAETRAETAHLRRELSRRASAPGPHLAAS
jgi:tetratricopeptide (TPR) repeat protein